MLVVALSFIATSLRVASDEGLMVHLVLSVLSSSMLPVLLVCKCRYADGGCRHTKVLAVLLLSRWLYEELRTLRLLGSSAFCSQY